MRPAIFLDRDGVVIENCPEYVRRWEDVKFIPSAVKALSRLASSKYLIIFVTNQSVVGRGIITIVEAERINQQIIRELTKKGCRVDGTFICPHAPEINCSCRKPMPGLLHQAAHSLQIELSQSIMIGDAWTDLQAGQAAGVERLALVLTGRGLQQKDLPKPSEISGERIYPDLATALEDIVFK